MYKQKHKAWWDKEGGGAIKERQKTSRKHRKSKNKGKSVEEIKLNGENASKQNGKPPG